MGNIFKRQSICIYFLFRLRNMDFEKRNFGLPFRRVLCERSWPLVDLFRDDSMVGKLYKKHLRS